MRRPPEGSNPRPESRAAGMIGSGWVPAALALVALSASCSDPPSDQSTEPATQSPPALAEPLIPSAATTPHGRRPTSGRGTVTLGFAGDLHFEYHLAALLRHPATALRSIAPALRRPDLMMVNLETAITGRGNPEPKDYHFRTSSRALQVLDAAGVDVVSLANNHAVDYGAVGLRDTLAAVRQSPIEVVGIGKDAAVAFRPAEFSVDGTRIAVLAATTRPDRTALAWSAGPDRPGVAVAIRPGPPRMVRAVRAAADRADVVVVFLHWGMEYQACPSAQQRLQARAMAAAGADVVVGSHAHVLLGAGWLADTYVDYGLGNFVWYNQNSVSTGILTLTVRDGRVVADHFSPADIQPNGLPRLLRGEQRTGAVANWQQLRGCTDLAPHRTPTD